jgi:hypothetical protein
MDKLIDWYGYGNAVIVKNLIIFGGGLLLGVFIGFLILAWLTTNSIRDMELDEVKIMRVRRNGKSKYVGNPTNMTEAIHGIFIILGWTLGLIRNNSVYYNNARVSKAFMYLFLLACFGLIAASLYLSFTILDLTRALHPIILAE